MGGALPIELWRHISSTRAFSALDRRQTVGAAASGTFAAGCPAIARPPHRARKHSRQGSNLQPSVLETAALPLELPEYKSRWADLNRHPHAPAGAWLDASDVPGSKLAVWCHQRCPALNGRRSALSYNGIIEAVRETEERKPPAKPKGGNYHGGSFRRLRRSGAPLCAVPLVLILPYCTPFRECRGITK